MSSIDKIHEINNFLNQHVPLFQAMEAKLERCDETVLAIAAPLEPNINDKGIAFGGSMAAIAALTGWAVTRITLDEHNETAEIVIADSTLKFLRPLRDSIVAECLRPDTATAQQFIDNLRQRGKVRWSLDVIIHADGEPAMTFTGRYGVYRPT
ncbi:MAG: hypothetical protein CSA09_01555 [Candidatus Contendobacter odensis]|uniref:Thioesterase putative domain-containing protein n=1 Tax=Candidatus Contendibacter odensensis TaxID=1400860 RepID=A0A2G6PH30_9GAMM|nr:MAG: hypothetical protein CSA09_01555 [Candidatus Contendobacter odensis]